MNPKFLSQLSIQEIEKNISDLNSYFKGLYELLNEFQNELKFKEIIILVKKALITDFLDSITGNILASFPTSEDLVQHQNKRIWASYEIHLAFRTD